MTTGRPRATSRDTIAEAACELFLECGFDATTIADITQRAGVSRSSFFNYFTSKSEVLWAGLDERIAGVERALADAPLSAAAQGDPAASVASALRAVGEGFAPDSLALALGNAHAMGLAHLLEREAGARRARIGALVARRLQASGIDAIEAEVAGAAYAGAVLASIAAWADAGAGQTPLAPLLERALHAAASTLPATQ